jgi:hypothetical protein
MASVAARVRKSVVRQTLLAKEQLVRGALWQQKLNQLRGLRERERCVVVGPGPSLGVTRLETIVDASFCGVGSLPFHPSPLEGKLRYYIATDRRFLKRCFSELVAFARRTPECTVFIPSRAVVDLGLLSLPAANIALFESEALDPALYSATELPRWTDERRNVVPLLRTVTACGAYLMSLLGYSRIYLVGCDAYGGIDKEQKPQAVGTFGDGHYYDGAASTRTPYDLMRLSLTHRMAYLGCELLVRQRGGRLFNATLGGAIDTLPRVPFDALCRPEDSA